MNRSDIRLLPSLSLTLAVLASLLAPCAASAEEAGKLRCGDGEAGRVEWIAKGEQGDYRAVLSARSGTVACVELLQEQYTQNARDDLPTSVPGWLSQEGPMQLVNTWDTAFLPFRFELAQGDQDKGPALTRTLKDPQPRLAAEKGWKAGMQVSAGFFELYAVDPVFTLVANEGGEAVYVWPDPKQDSSDVFIERRLRQLDNYRLALTVRVLNFGKASLVLYPGLAVHGWALPGSSSSSSMFSPPPNVLEPSCLAGGTFVKELPDKLLKDVELQNPKGKTSWVAVGDRYFMLAAVNVNMPDAACHLAAGQNGVASAVMYRTAVELLPGESCIPAWLQTRDGVRCSDLAATMGLDVRNIYDRTAFEKAFMAKGKELENAGILSAAASHIKSKNWMSYDYNLFAGPKTIDLLKSAGEGLEASLDFGMLAFLSKPMLLVMRWFHSIIPSWVLAIIFLTILVKVIMLPLTQKSYVSMQKMSSLKPHMDRIKEKYGKDKERMNQEVMNLYKREKINPLGGCLPMLIQMPIWIALYKTLYSAVELYKAPLGLWIHDLSAPDPFFVMPLLLGVFMFVQQKMTPTTMDAQQAKIMLYVMPAMFTVFMLFLPSGLNLYILVNTILSLLQQYYLKRKFTSGGPLAAA